MVGGLLEGAWIGRVLRGGAGGEAGGLGEGGEVLDAGFPGGDEDVRGEDLEGDAEAILPIFAEDGAFVFEEGGAEGEGGTGLEEAGGCGIGVAWEGEAEFDEVSQGVVPRRTLAS